MKTKCLSVLAMCASLLSVGAWDYEGHRMVNQIALASLPTNFPAFVSTAAAAERIAFLAGEPDRWRNTPDLSLKHCNGPDHYIDMEELHEYGLKPAELPVFRFDFAGQLAVTRAAHPDKFPKPDPEQDADHTRGLVGMLPWSITENYGKLKSGFSYLKAFEQYGGTPEEIANAQANIIYVMGVMGHYVGDGSQPLHATIHHHGWIGDNPNNYRTNKSIHSWIDGGYFNKVGMPTIAELKPDIRVARFVQFGGRDASADEIFPAVVQYIQATEKEVEPLYQLDKSGALSGNGTKGLEGRKYLSQRLIVGGQMLGDIWYSAWQHAPPDNYLRDQLKKRAKVAAGKAETGSK
ncbi:MAG: hypothetical protein RLY20_821 [Verrucomicrobiota bacterium]|jgi:hypothetical protein